jgi:ribose transport system substrate-binding protein
MQHILKTTLTASVFALSMGTAQAQDLTPLNSDSEPDRMDWSELETKFGAFAAPPAGTKVGGVSKTLTN